MRKKIGASLVILLLICAALAFGQILAPPSNGLMVVADCDTAPTGYPAANIRAPGKADTVGRICVVSKNAVATSGGTDSFVLEPAGSDNHTNIKNGPGQVYGIQAFTIHTAPQYVRLYNAGSGFNGCNSATNLKWSGIVPAAATGNGYAIDFSVGKEFTTGISICVTGAYGNTSTTAATASVSELNIDFK